MPHPGNIIYASDPGTAGWSFFYVVYHHDADAYAVRCRPENGEPQQYAGEAPEVVRLLEGPLAAAVAGDGRVPLRAAAVLRRHAGTA